MRLKAVIFPVIVASLTLTGYFALPAGLSSAAPASAVHHGTAKVTVTQHLTYQTAGLTVRTTLRSKVAPGQVAALRAASVKLFKPGTFPGGGGSYVPISCNTLYTWSISAGSFTYQHACDGTTSPWGWKFSDSYCDRITSSVQESGIVWVRNGTTMPQQAPHTQSCLDQFHSTFNPLYDGDDVAWADQYTYIIIIDGQPNSGLTSIWGYIHQNGD